MEILITTISEALRKGASDLEIDSLISEFTGFTEQSDIDNWRKAHYLELRGWAYPDFKNYLDAQVKLSSSDETLHQEGQAQLNAYFALCFGVKDRFPKS